MAGRSIPYTARVTLAECLVRGMSVERAAKVADVSRATAYSWLTNGDADFERAMEAARIAKVRRDCDMTGMDALRADRHPGPDSLPEDGNMIPSVRTE